MLRTFIAARIPVNPALVDLHRRLSRFGEPLRPIPVDSLHVTLKFLGPTERGKLDEIAVIAKEIAARHSAHTVELHGLGAFPNARRPSIVWVGIRNADALCSIAAALEAELAPLGFTPEQRPFQPHLTVLRVKTRPPDALLSLLDEAGDAEFGTANITAVEFFQSEPQRGGSRYTVLTTAPLAAE